MPGNAYLKTTSEAKRLWQKQGRLQQSMHSEQWRLFVLLNARPQDRAKVSAQRAEVQRIAKEMADVRAKLQPLWVQPQGGQPNRPRAGAGAGTRTGGGRG